jgi:hypothetical protein
MAVMLGPAVAQMFAFEPNTIGNTDTKTYIGLSKGELNQNPKRKYRVIVPAMAAVVNVGNPVWSKLAPKSFQGDFGLDFSFLVVNILLMSLFGVLIYQYLKTFDLDIVAIAAGLLVMLTARYTSICAGLPFAESLYLVVIGTSLLGIRKQDKKLLLISIFLGPFAKEAFIFIAPLIFFFSSIPKGKQFMYFLLSGLLVFGFRYLFDVYANLPIDAGLKADLGHIATIRNNLLQLFSFRGMYGLFSVVGVWLFFIVIGMRSKINRQVIFNKLHCCLLISVFIQIILSGAVERMFYLAIPVLSLASALGVKDLIGRRKMLFQKLT